MPLAAGAPDGVGDGPRHNIDVDHHPFRYCTLGKRRLRTKSHQSAARSRVQPQEAHARRANIEPEQGWEGPPEKLFYQLVTRTFSVLRRHHSPAGRARFMAIDPCTARLERFISHGLLGNAVP
jgi:hypothetical protein